jgi:hypothetical protein
METRLKVLIYGDTLLLAGLQASLAGYATLDVTVFGGQSVSAEELCAARPDAVLFDLEAVPPAFLSLLTRTLPDLLLVGVDAATNRVLIWSEQPFGALSTCDLVKLLGRRRPQQPCPGPMAET